MKPPSAANSSLTHEEIASLGQRDDEQQENEQHPAIGELAQRGGRAGWADSS